jgi:hypothetical protein
MDRQLELESCLVFQAIVNSLTIRDVHIMGHTVPRCINEFPTMILGSKDSVLLGANGVLDARWSE